MKSKIDSILKNTAEFIKADNDREDYNRIAVELYDLHRNLNPVYRKYSVGEVSNMNDIPLMPISEFKTSDVRLTLEGMMPFPGVEFHSSGTSQQDKSKHRMFDTEYYRMSITKGLQKFVTNTTFPQYRVILLTPRIPNSSLYYMMQYASELLDRRGIREEFYQFDDSFALSILLSSLRKEDDPVILFGTSLAFYDLMNNVTDSEQVKLPFGSIMIETGGWKSRSISINPIELTSKVSQFFGIPGVDCIREYSMSELSSQMYSFNYEGYQSTESLKWKIVDPLTQGEVPKGESGAIGFIDLANVWSCPFILTEDIGHIRQLGPEYTYQLVLEGRAIDTAEKGCSISYDEVKATMAD